MQKLNQCISIKKNYNELIYLKFKDDRVCIFNRIIKRFPSYKLTMNYRCDV